MKTTAILDTTHVLEVDIPEPTTAPPVATGRIIQVYPSLFFPALYASFRWLEELHFEPIAAYGLTDYGQVLALVRDFGTGCLCPADEIEGFKDLLDDSDLDLHEQFTN